MTVGRLFQLRTEPSSKFYSRIWWLTYSLRWFAQSMDAFQVRELSDYSVDLGRETNSTKIRVNIICTEYFRWQALHSDLRHRKCECYGSMLCSSPRSTVLVEAPILRCPNIVSVITRLLLTYIFNRQNEKRPINYYYESLSGLNVIGPSALAVRQ